MLLEEKWSLVEDFDDDWRVGLVLQGAAASREPSIETLRQLWTTKRRSQARPEMEASAVHERQVLTVRTVEAESACQTAPVAPVVQAKRQRRTGGGVVPRRSPSPKSARPKTRSAVVRGA
jgi:hypothetical protein